MKQHHEASPDLHARVKMAVMGGHDRPSFVYVPLREARLTQPATTLPLVLALCVSVGLFVRCDAGQASALPAPAARVVELHLNDEINPVTAEYVDTGIDQANRERAALILITMDTPGGLDTSMRDIIQHVLDSSAPVAVYVTPTGSRAASAGFFILLSADIAAMTPGTHTGAASPLVAIGGYPIAVDETLKNKILNDANAYLRSYASRRGRNVMLAETAITEAKAFTEREALDGKLIDLVADSRDALVAMLDGRTITRFDGRTSRLDLTNPEIVSVEMSARQRVLARIVEPDALLILLVVGVLGLYVEFTHPGLVAPGVVGGIALLLALFAMQLLPINATGLLLLVLAFALFVLDVQYAGHGVLGAGGVVAMLLGALMLVRSPLTGAGVSLGAALGATLPFALITTLLMRLVVRSRAWLPQTGVETLVDDVGNVTEAIDGGADSQRARGMVLVRGELWRAASTAAIPKGTPVRVVRVDGLMLYVEPAK
jgi:membrane-bound serine protease (ClpP class)